MDGNGETTMTMFYVMIWFIIQLKQPFIFGWPSGSRYLSDQEIIYWNYLQFQDASHHQDYEPFLVGNPYKPLFVTVTGWGGVD